MKRCLPAVAVVLAFAATGALAGWQPQSVSGTPKDMQVQDAGHVVFTTSTGAFDLVYSPDGGYRDAGAIVASSVVGAWHDYDGGRPGAVDIMGLFRWPSSSYTISSVNSLNRMRHTSSGMAYLIGLPMSSGVPDLFLEPGGGVNPPWQPVSDPGSIIGAFSNLGSVALSALRSGGADYAIFNVPLGEG